MLPDRISRLLSACIDGELDRHQRKAVLRLLRRSSEARELLSDLQKDAEQLRGLPRQTLGQDFSEQVLQIIGSRKAESTRRSAVTVRSTIPAWLGLATAAAVLFVVGLGSTIYFVAADRQKQTEPWAGVEEPELPAIQERLVERGVPAPDPVEPSTHERLGFPAPEALVTTSSSTAADDTAGGKPQVDPKSPALGSPLRRHDMHFKDPEEQPIVLVLNNLRDLHEEKWKQHLDQELQKGAAHRLNLRCTDTLAGIERLQTAFKSQGIQVVIDEHAQAVLKLGMGKNTTFALYFEEVTAAEMVAILRQCSSEDRKTESKHGGRARFESLMVNAITWEEQQKFTRLLGFEPAQSPAPMPKGKAAVDVRKPLSADTQEQVLQSLRVRGTPPPPESAKPALKTLDRQALVVTYPPGRARPTSTELKRFLDNRGEHRAGTVPNLLVLSPPKG